MSTVFKQLPKQSQEELLSKLQTLPVEQQAKILLQLLKQPT